MNLLPGNDFTTTQRLYYDIMILLPSNDFTTRNNFTTT